MCSEKAKNNKSIPVNEPPVHEGLKANGEEVQTLLTTIADTSKSARAIFFIQMTFALYSMVTIFSTKDIDFLNMQGTLRLPLANVDISYRGVFLLGPFLILCFQVYLFFYVFHLRRLLFRLRSIESERSGDYSIRIYPWSINILALNSCKNSYGLFARLVFGFIFSNSFWVFPAFVVWLYMSRYSVVQSEVDTTLQSILVILSATFMYVALTENPNDKEKGFAWRFFICGGALVLFFFFYFSAISIRYHQPPGVYPSFFSFATLKKAPEKEQSKNFISLTDLFTPSKTDTRVSRIYRKTERSIYEGIFIPNTMSLQNHRLTNPPSLSEIKLEMDIRSHKPSNNVNGDDILNQIKLSKDNNINLRKLSLRYANLCGAYMDGMDLFEADLEGAWLYGAHLRNANLRKANLKNAWLEGAYMENADLEDANGEGALFTGAHLEGANLRDAHFEKAVFNFAHMEDANLTLAKLREATFRSTHLDRVDFRFADLGQAAFWGAQLNEAFLFNTNLCEAWFFDTNVEKAIIVGSFFIKTDIYDSFFDEACIFAANYLFSFDPVDNLFQLTFADNSIYKTMIDENSLEIFGLSKREWKKNGGLIGNCISNNPEFKKRF